MILLCQYLELGTRLDQTYRSYLFIVFAVNVIWKFRIWWYINIYIYINHDANPFCSSKFESYIVYVISFNFKSVSKRGYFFLLTFLLNLALFFLAHSLACTVFCFWLHRKCWSVLFLRNEFIQSMFVLLEGPLEEDSLMER